MKTPITGANPFSANFASAAENEHAISKAGQERESRMAWWREARFGLFVHWGLYSGLAGHWKGERVENQGPSGLEWLQYYVKADTWEYAHQAIPHFRPAESFAEQWARMAREAGCRYLVFTTKHHEGFCLHDSNVTTFDAKDLIDRDLCEEITDACRKEGLKVGFYHSVIDWHHPQFDYNILPHPLNGKPSPNGPRNHKLYVDYLHRQVEELMTNYGKLDILWWDFSKENAEGSFWQANELMALVRKYQPGIVSNNRLYRTPEPRESTAYEDLGKNWNSQQGDFITPEQFVPSTGISGVDWEVCLTLNETWGYNEHDHKWKSEADLIRTMIEVVSKGGNFLLNIGPKGDGSIPEESVELLTAIGRWMKVNSESIYGTTVSPFDKPLWGRYTRKPGRIYAHIFDWPQKGSISIPVKDTKVICAYLLADKEQKDLKIEHTQNGLLIHLPKKAPDVTASVVVIELDEED